MAKSEITIPQMGESIIEATITRWLKNEGDHVSEDESVVEIATDKVDSEIPSPVEGTLLKILFPEGETVPVGKVIALISAESGQVAVAPPVVKKAAAPAEQPASPPEKSPAPAAGPEAAKSASRFYSPLIRSMAKEEHLTPEELENIRGTGQDGRVTKADLLQYLEALKFNKVSLTGGTAAPAPVIQATPAGHLPEAGDTVIEMDRMRKLIAEHMVASKHTSAHVTSVLEADVTGIVLWRQKNKDLIKSRENENLTFTPIVIEAMARAVKEVPGVNASVDGTRIILHKAINIGMAAALPNGNLIVPVIRNVDQKSLLGLVKQVNDLAGRARTSKLLPDDITGGTLTLTNYGSAGTLLGTPIINQPQVAILGIGAIQKRPVVLETPLGDTIGIRHMVYLSLSYDHRVIDGALAGLFLVKVKKYLEEFDINRII